MLRCVGGRWRINLIPSSGCYVFILIFPLEFNRPAACELIFCRSFCFVCFFSLMLTKQSCALVFPSLAVASSSDLFILFFSFLVDLWLYFFEVIFALDINATAMGMNFSCCCFRCTHCCIPGGFQWR